MASSLPIPSCSAEAILAERDAIVRAAEHLAQLVGNAPVGFPRLWMDGRRGDRVEFDLAQVRRDADARAWDTLLRETGLWSFMDKLARDQWVEMIQGPRYSQRGEAVEQLPPFTLEAAEDLVRGIHADRGKMVARGVAEVFRRLSPDYRSNGPRAFGPRVIIKGLGSVWGGGKWLHINHDVAHKLDDLGRFLCLARGLPEPDHRTGGAFRLLSDAADKAPAVVSMDWWTVKLFKNGNGHLVFKHAEDVDRLNRLLAAHSRGLVADDVRRR